MTPALLRTAKRALQAGLELAEFEEDQRGDNDKLYPISARATARKLRAAFAKVNAALTRKT